MAGPIMAKHNSGSQALKDILAEIPSAKPHTDVETNSEPANPEKASNS